MLEEHRGLQTQFDDVSAEKDEALSRAQRAEKEADFRRNDKSDALMRAEIDRLRGELCVYTMNMDGMVLMGLTGRRARRISR